MFTIIADKNSYENFFLLTAHSRKVSVAQFESFALLTRTDTRINVENSQTTQLRIPKQKKFSNTFCRLVFITGS